MGVDEEILELWEAACNSICEAEPPAPLEAIAVLDLIARDATRLVDEQIVSLLGDGIATPTTIGQTLGMSRQAVMKRAHIWTSHYPPGRLAGFLIEAEGVIGSG